MPIVASFMLIALGGAVVRPMRRARAAW